MKNKIHFFTKYTPKGPSSRYRTYQYLPYFSEEFETLIHPFFDDQYLICLENGTRYSKWQLLARVLKVFKSVLFGLNNRDLVVIEYEFVPYFPPILEYVLKLRGIKFILDYDDAIFHNYDLSGNRWVRRLLEKKIPTIMKWASAITTGSPYLTTFSSIYNHNVIEIPTSVSSKIYQAPHFPPTPDDRFNIGWVGSKTTGKNLIELVPALLELSKSLTFQLSLIGFDKNLEPLLSGLDYKIIQWTKDKEIDEIRKFDVGIMPLTNTAFNNGKCGFKLVQYMACGLPTISTPLLANVKINRSGQNLHAKTTQEWIAALTKVHNNRAFFTEVGAQNYQDFISYYCTENNVNTYINLYNSISELK